MTVAVNMRMHWSRRHKDNLWCLHWVMLREIDLKLIGLIRIESSRRSSHLNHPPLEIVSDFVFKPRGRINLPLQKLLLKAIAGNLTQNLAGGGGGAGHGGEREERDERM